MRILARKRRCALLLPVLTGLGLSGPLQAQDSGIAELDALTEQSKSPDSTMELARQQADAGELLEAAATLERYLIVDENADDVRLAYAAVLCRLDDRQSARLELKALRGRSASRAAWDGVEAACGAELAEKRDDARFSGSISVGVAYEDDAFGALRVQPNFFFPPFREDGLSFIGSAQLAGRFGDDAAHIYADVRAQTKNRLSGPDADYQFGEAELGFGGAWGDTRLTVGGVVRYGRFEDEPYLTEYGGAAQIGLRAGRRGRAAIRGEVVRQDFEDGFRTGYHYDLALSYEHRAPSRLTWFFGAGIELKDARVKTAEYTALRVTGAMELPLDQRGSYSRISSTLRYVDFKNEPFDLPRKDLRLHNRLAFGTPLGIRGLFAEAAATYSYRDYNAASDLLDYGSFGGDLRLIWNFGAGR
jgi:hypothetical protein